MAAAKRKASAVNDDVPALKRRASSRIVTSVNPDINRDVLDGPNALRASPDNDVNQDIAPASIKRENGTRSESPLSDAPAVVEPPKKGARKAKAKKDVQHAEEDVAAVVDAASEPRAAPKGGRKPKVKTEPETEAVAAETPVKAPAAKKAKKNNDDELRDPEADDDEEAGEEEIQEALSRPPPVNSDYLPLPWKGRLGYACLNTYLRQSNPPVFSSRTCRIQSILEHRHPLQDPSQPEHATKNKPDRTKPASVELGQKYVENLCLANIKDIEKMLRWNDKYNIKFLRLSSEMFPFASHPEYGYKLAPFASEALAAAGRVVAELGHRVTTHPGQFTQLGSPRQSVIDNAIRDLEYHDELLSLLKLPPQQDRDAVMILHMGGIFDGKEGVLQRFRENYVKLPQSVKNRLVLENDDMGWSVHDLLPICEELNIPMVLDYHHHNIVFDPTQIREGTKDIMDLYPRIAATWARKNIKQKMHYSEPTPPAITPRQRRKHSPRVMSLPPCAPDMDLMIEAKDKEQAVFELMRTFRLPGFEKLNDILPYTRKDDNKLALQTLSKKKKDPSEPDPELIPDEEVGMGGPDGRVYWPPGMEEWLRPKKREVKPKKDPADTAKDKEKIRAKAAELVAAREAKNAAEANGVKDEPEEESDLEATPATKKAKAAMKKKEAADKAKAVAKREADEAKRIVKEEAKIAKEQKQAVATPVRKRGVKKEKVKEEVVVPTPSPSEMSEEEDGEMDFERDEEMPALSSAGRRRVGTGRRAKTKAVSYVEEEEE